MLERLELLEQQARQLEPNAATRTEWEQSMTAYAHTFLENLDTLPAFSENAGLPPNLAFQESGRTIKELLAFLANHTDKYGLNPASPKHFGYIPGGGVYPTAIGDYLAAVTNRYVGIYFSGPGGVAMENQLIRWMCNFMGYPETALGNLSSGGSIANLIAIIAARDHAGLKGVDYHKAVIYLTEHVHHCVQKALRLSGLAEAVVRYIPVDASFKMISENLDHQIQEDLKAGLKPFLLVGSAGTTNTGVIDPLDQLADIAEKYKLWYHVDAAYGGFFNLLENQKAKFKGIERSDSITIDPHKGLFLSYGLGAILVKNPEQLLKSNHYTADYMQDATTATAELSPADLSPELTKHFRGLRMWISLQLFGLTALKAAMEEKILLCQYFYEAVQKIGFEVGPFPELSVMIFRYVPKEGDPNDFNKAIVEYTRKEKSIFISTTTINGTYWLRMAVMSFRTHKQQIDDCLEILKQGVKHLE